MERQMKTIMITIALAFLSPFLSPVYSTWADSGDQQGNYDTQPDNYLFTPDELHDLLAPIALYPDPLIAQILPAATFIDQIDEAARYLRQYGTAARIDDQPWDVSVKSVAHYPNVLFMMDQKYDWSVSLGQAFINQGEDVMDAIQQLRNEAQAVGNLYTTPQQQIISEGGAISIVPAAPDMIYVPQYDPLAVYAERSYSSYGLITFGVGFTIGAWLNRDCDWNRHVVYYHGWQGGGWIGRTGPYVRNRNNIYISTVYRTTATSRRVLQHDTRRFREDIHRNVQVRREHGGQPAPSVREQRPGAQGASHQGTPPRPGVQTSAPPVLPSRPTPAPTSRPQRPDNRDVYRGREPKGTQTAPYSGYGSYGSRGEAPTYRARGQASRGSVPQPTVRPPAPARSQPSAPAQRQGNYGGRQSVAPAVRPAPAQPAPVQTAPAAKAGEGRQRPQR